jgi:hypothetical protein
MNNKIYRFLIIIPILNFLSCEQKFDNVIDSFNNDYQVENVLPSEDFYFNPTDSLVTISIKFNSVGTIQNVSCDVYASDDYKLLTIDLYDDGLSSSGDTTKGDKIYSNKLPLSKYYPNGIYTIKYFVTDKSNTLKPVAYSYFNYINGQNNVAPVISNLILVDSTAREVPITFSVDVSDSNGLSDILKVYYELYRPNGTKVYNSQGISQFPLFDNGDTASNGDLFADDGRYTVKLTFPNSPSVPSGDWRFEFQAEDRSGALSEKIIKSVKVL